MRHAARLRIAALVTVVCAASSSSAVAQTAGPVWAKHDLFWYARPVTGGMMWMQVDAKAGSHGLLFDHTRMASDLSTALETRFTAATLPFATRDAHFVVKFDGSNAAMQSGAMAIEFVRSGERWRCDLEGEWDWPRASDYYCASQGAFDRVEEPLSDSAPRISPDGSWEALVVNNNVVVRRVGATATTALSKDGTPTFSYHAGSLAWSTDSKTLGAYRVNAAIWSAANVGANVKQHVVHADWLVR